MKQSNHLVVLILVVLLSNYLKYKPQTAYELVLIKTYDALAEYVEKEGGLPVSFDFIDDSILKGEIALDIQWDNDIKKVTLPEYSTFRVEPSFVYRLTLGLWGACELMMKLFQLIIRI